MPRKSDTDTPPAEPIWRTLRYGAEVVWSAGRGHCIAMGAGALFASLLAPITIVVLGVIVSELNDIIAGKSAATSSLNLWVMLVSIATFAAVAVAALQRYGKMRLRDALSLRMESDILKHAATLDSSVFDDRNVQNILDRARQTPGQAILNLLDGVVETGSGALQLCALAGVLIWIEPWWTSALLVAIVPFFLSSFWMSRVRHELNRIKTTQRRWTRYYSRMLTDRECVQSVKLFSLSPLMIERHSEKMTELMQSHRKAGLTELWLNLVSSLLIVGALAGAIWFAARRAATGELEVGSFTVFWMAAWRFRDSVGKLGNSLSSILDARLAITNLREFFALTPRRKVTGTNTDPISGEMELRNVSFRYTHKSPVILDNVSLKIGAGEVVALVGPNGAGKSTLAKLLSRLYEPTSGEMFIDGKPASDISLEHYHRQVSFVLQIPTRFEATAHENIAFGDWKNLLSDPERVKKLAEFAGADELIDHLPAGYDTLLGRQFGEHDLSGGQWKKLALSAALASDPRIVILDEPAANLDVQTETLIHQQLRRLLKNRTTILISHHFSTVRIADRIVVVVDGRVVEQGTHDELVQFGGVYASMCQAHENLITGTPLNASDPPSDGEGIPRAA